MKKRLKNIFAVTCLSLAIAMPSAAAAECYIDYKAKQTNSGLKLHYGVMRLSDQACNNNAQEIVKNRLAKSGWILLRIVSKFNQSGLAQRKQNAGAYFLRY